MLEKLFADWVLNAIGKWKRGKPKGCATKCGVGLGMSGTPGTVKCSMSSCDAEKKPAAKKCAKTVDCGVCADCCCLDVVHVYAGNMLVTVNCYKRNFVRTIL